MDTLITAAGVAGLYVANLLIMYGLAYFLTEVIALPWHVKPWTCRECLAFWFTVLGGVVLALVVVPRLVPCACGRALLIYALIGASVLSGLVNYLYIKTKFKIYA